MITWWEILIIIILIGFVSLVFGIRIYKMIKHIPIDECKCSPSGSSLRKWYNKTYKKSNNNCNCKVK